MGLIAFLLDTLAEVTAGERIALVLLSVMALLAMKHDDELPLAPERARPLQLRAWRLIAWAAIAFSPFHAAWLLGTPSPPVVVRVGDAAASGFACAAMVTLLAALGTERGLTPARVRSGTIVNVSIVLFLVAFACLTP